MPKQSGYAEFSRWTMERWNECKYCSTMNGFGPVHVLRLNLHGSFCPAGFHIEKFYPTVLCKLIFCGEKLLNNIHDLSDSIFGSDWISTN